MPPARQHRTQAGPPPGGMEPSCWIGKRGLTWLELGDAAAIEIAVGDLLKAANAWSVSISRHEDRVALSAEQTASTAAREIARRVWLPLEPAIMSRGPVRRLRISPDSTLNLVPFEALTGKDGTPLIERFSVAYLPAGRDLVAPAPTTISSGRSVVVVEYGLAPLPTSRLATADFPALTHAASEARELSALLSADLKSGRSASEAAVEALRRSLHPASGRARQSRVTPLHWRPVPRIGREHFRGNGALGHPVRRGL